MPTRARRLLAILSACSVLVSLPMPAAAARPGPSGPSTVQFSGLTWTVKSYNRKIGPGPNLFSADNVSVDSAGRLHLEIEPSGKRWTTAEVIANASLGYGTYTWTVATPAALDPNVVLGMFTWNDDPAYAHREIDIEWARWGNASDPTNAQYVVQPYDAAGHELRFAQPASVARSIHSFTWSPDAVTFSSRDAAGTWSNAWSFNDAAAVPVPGGENPRINLWLFRGAAPTDGQPVEVIIESFSHTPLGG